MKPARKKWRPSAAMVVTLVCLSLISVPLLALLAVRLTSNQFVRETEQSLIHQGAIYAELFADAFAALEGPQIGTALDDEQKAYWNANLHPARAQLNVHRDPVAPVRPEGVPVNAPLDPRYVAITDRLLQVARQSQRTTLSGIVFLDHTGRALNTEGAPTHAALDEVQTALGGDIGAMLRERGDAYVPHPLASLSRDTGYRVFVTYPVITGDHVIGVVYLSRTPLNLGKFLFQERYALLTMLASTVLGAGIIGWLLLRLISRPIYALRDASQGIAEGKSVGLETIPHYGLSELANLGDSVATMAATLSQRSKEISTYTDHVTHELKSPVTSIIGAAELLQNDTLGAPDRSRLISNIETEANRMNTLLGQLRNMTRLRTDTKGVAAKLQEILPDTPEIKIDLLTDPAAMLPLSAAHGQIILNHMIQNAVAHEATIGKVAFQAPVLSIHDNGTGIPAPDIARVTEPFFTTRRDEGGTGMGLAIVQAVLDNYGAELVCLPSQNGALFEIRFPT